MYDLDNIIYYYDSSIKRRVATLNYLKELKELKEKLDSEYDREKAILYAAVKKLATKKEYDNILRTIDKGRTNDEWM